MEMFMDRFDGLFVDEKEKFERVKSCTLVLSGRGPRYERQDWKDCCCRKVVDEIIFLDIFRLECRNFIFVVIIVVRAILVLHVV